MGVEFSLACNECKVFLSLDKWPVIKLAGDFLVHAHYSPTESYYDDSRCPKKSPFPLFQAESGQWRLTFTSTELLAAQNTESAPGNWNSELSQQVLDFAEAHFSHPLFLCCDYCGVEPWNFDGQHWIEWRESLGKYYFHSYLPRNLIEQPNCKSWPEAETFLREKHPWLLDIQMKVALSELKLTFEKLLPYRKYPI